MEGSKPLDELLVTTEGQKNQSKIEIVYPVLWGVLGLFGVSIGIERYLFHSQGLLTTFYTPTIISVRNIVFGVLSIWIGIRLFYKPKQIQKWLYAYPSWILGIMIIGVVLFFFVKRICDLDLLVVTLDYLYIPLAYYTIRNINEKGMNQKVSLGQFIKENFLFLGIGIIILLVLIWGLAELFPYSLFFDLH